MAGGVRFRPKFVDNSLKAIRDARAEGLKAVRASAVDLQGKAVRKIREEGLVDTGTLRASIAHKVQGSGPKAEAFVGTSVHYAIYVHEGTGRFYDGPLPQRGGANPPWIYPDPKTGAFILTYGNPGYKFLETPLLENVERYQKIIRDTLRSGMLRWTRE